MSISVSIVGDHRLFVECINVVLQQSGQFHVLQPACTIEDALNGLELQYPDVYIVDVDSFNGAAHGLIRRIAQKRSQAKILIIGSEQATLSIVEAIEAGASGYVSREASLNDLTKAVEQVYEGHAVCPKELTQSVFRRLTTLGKNRRNQLMKESRLTPRELAVLKLMSSGKSNKQIASIMYVSVYTVKNHVHNILNKLNAESRAAAVHYACSKPWILPKIDSD